MIDTFLSRPTWVPGYIGKRFERFYPLLAEYGFNPRTIGKSVQPVSSRFDDVVNLINQCSCTIVLGFPQIWVDSGRVKDNEIGKRFSLPTEWNQIEAAISIMLGKPTLMMIHAGVATRGLFERGAANVFVHEFHTMGHKWVEELEPKLEALRKECKVNSELVSLEY